jgi:acetyltransferase-like isoleucine patch superfamily enzyme
MPQSRQTFTRDALSAYGFDIGRHTYGTPTIHWWGEPAALKIGSFCSIAKGVQIFLGGNHRADWVTTYPFSALADWPQAEAIPGHPASRGDVVIGNDVWIAADAMIHSGVTIGDGAVIGAASVVRRDVPPYAIVIGNPAQVTRKRFSEPQIAALLAIRWWDWDDDRIREALTVLMSSDLNAFLERCGVGVPSQAAPSRGMMAGLNAVFKPIAGRRSR